VRNVIAAPLAVGFGISTPAHVRTLHGHAAIAVVGRAVLNLIGNTKPDVYLPELDRYRRSMLAT